MEHHFGLWGCKIAFLTGVSNVKYLTYDTPNTKKSLSWDVSNTIIFTTYKQYYPKDETVQIEKLKKYIVFYSFSLSSFMTFSLLSLSFSFSFFFLRHSFISVTLFSSFLLPFFFFFLQKLPLFVFYFFLSFFLFFFFYHFLCHLFFFLVTLSLFLLFSSPKPLPLRLAVAVEFDLTIACKFGPFFFIIWLCVSSDCGWWWSYSLGCCGFFFSF